MENTRTTNETESSEARVARLERTVKMLTEALRLQQQNQQPRLLRYSQSHLKMKPPSFQGGLEPLKAEAWFLETEKLFEVFSCSEAHKVLLATFTLQEEAKRWWMLVRDTDTKYFPQCVRDRKVTEFEQLKQCTMCSVTGPLLEASG
ncbi:hypothetical protein CsSME_00036115 [Camellia sinensis var. sinensis]